MDLLLFIILVAVVIFLWPLIKAYALFLLVAAVIWWIFTHRNGPRL